MSALFLEYIFAHNVSLEVSNTRSHLRTIIDNEYRQYVYHDLQPYCCTFEDCSTANRLYESQHAWFSHELEMHRTSFQCIEGCGKIFQARSELGSRTIYSSGTCQYGNAPSSESIDIKERQSISASSMPAMQEKYDDLCSSEALSPSSGAARSLCYA